MSSTQRRDRLVTGLACALKWSTRGARGILLNNHVQTAQQIRDQVDVLAPYFDFISYGELAVRLREPREKKPFCLLTFDDGKAINALETAPELLRLGVPAVFYLVTGAMDAKTAFWFDRFRALRRICEPAELPTLTEWKAMPWRVRDAQLDALCGSVGVEVDLSDPLARSMSWGEAIRLVQNGFEMGSHTVNHAVLTVETEDEARRQMERSFADFVQNGLPPCRTFAFPNGNASSELVAGALSAGVESTVTTAPVWVRHRDELACLPRLYFKERATPRHLYLKTLAARTGCLLANPNGEGRRYVFSRGS